ncbi:MAG: serine/threonine-protein kinase, partial [bacterium]
MNCDISGEQLWSWIDRDAPELDEHLAVCPTCRARAAKIRDEIKQLAQDEAFEFPVPDKIDSYKIIRLIGEGGQALVYEAEQASPRRRVALKVLKGGHLVGKKDIRKFRRESQALGRLNHPSIAPIFESGRTQEGLHYFAMELVEGLPLHAFVNEKNPKQEEVLDIFRSVCEAVQYAHDHGVIHRDLKPSNIMIDQRGSPKILDFGLARMTRGDYGTLMTATRYGSVEGTPRYMSPEQDLGHTDEIDARTDVYALGVVLYEILTGQPPNRVTVISADTIRTICEELPPKPSHVAPHLGEGLDAIVLKALEKAPDDRYASVAEMREDIGRHLEGKPVLASTRGRFYVLRKRLSKQRRPLGITALVLVGITAAAVWLPKKDRPDPGAARRVVLEYKYAMFLQDASDFNYYEAREAPRRLPDSPEAVLVAAQSYCLTRGQNVAMGLLFRAQGKYPDYWPYDVLINEIRAWQRPGDTALADTSYWNADLALSADAWYERSFATLDMKHALAWAQQALEREPTHELALTTVALASEILDDPERAIATAQILIDTHPDLANKWMHYRAELLVRMDRLQEALDQSLEWQKVSPDFYYAYLMAAKVARRMSRFADAERYFTLAIEKQGPDDPQTT